MTYQSIYPKSIQQLPKIKDELQNSKEDYAVIKLKFIRPYCVAYLDQTIRYIRKEKDIRLMPWQSKVHQYLDQCGFEFLLGNCSHAKKYDDEIIIPLIRFSKSDNIEVKVVNWLDKDVFRFIPVNDNKLKKKIIENLWEIVDNGITHGMSEFGVSACGQFYPKREYFEVAFYDAGIGMARKIKQYGAVKETEPDFECIKWALQKGTSTLNVPAAGMGLFYLRNFVNVNKGTIQFISGEGFLDIPESFNDGAELNNKIEGTLVNIRINYKN